jgi:hypothetical protein
MDKQTIAERKAHNANSRLDEHEEALIDEKLDKRDGFFIGVCAGLLTIIWLLIFYGAYKTWLS